SIVQENVFRIECELPGLPQFNLPYIYRLQGPLNVPALERSLTEVMRRHDSLRTAFDSSSEGPMALVLPAAETRLPLVVVDLAKERAAQNGRANALLLKKAELEAEQESWAPFDLSRAPLFRARLFRLGPDDHVLVFVLHHIIVDGWSMGVFFEEVSKLYSGFAAGQDVELPEPSLRFSDIVHWQRRWCTTDPAARQLAYWKNHLREVSPVFPAEGGVTGAPVSRIAHEPIHLPNELVGRLSAFGRSQ